MTIFKGTKIICPQCEETQDLLAYTPLSQIKKYQEFTTPILKCRLCKHVFAPIYSTNELLFLIKSAKKEKSAQNLPDLS